jgi:6-phosphogluconolactonase
MKYELHRFPNRDALARAAADQWLDQIARQSDRDLYAAISGGRISRNFFSALAESSQTRGIPLENIHFFWADERCVPPDDPESNYGMAQELLFGPLNLNVNHIHRIKGELDSMRAAAQAEVEFMEIVPKNQQGESCLDFVFLGMGEDGHVASLFPEEPDELMREAAVYRPVKSLKPPPNRVTLDYGPILAAGNVWALVSGAGKEPVLKAALEESGKTPLAKILQKRERTVIFTDTEI